MPYFDVEKFLQKAVIDRGFYPEAFKAVLAHESSPLAKIWKLEEEEALCRNIEACGLQDAFKFRCTRRARFLAESVVDEAGEVSLKSLAELASLIQDQGLIPTPHGYSDPGFSYHVLAILKKFETDKSLRFLIKKFQLPLCHKYAEEIIRTTLSLQEDAPLSDRDLRVAVVSACLYPLRQNVGSCFATAPAILIQKEQIENLLHDLYDLLTTGKTTRTIGGKECSVPLSPSIGVGDLRKNVTIITSTLGEKIPLSIILPLEKMGLFTSNLSDLQKKEWVLEKLKDFLSFSSVLTVEGFFRFVILSHLQITEEEIQTHILEEQNMARTFRKQEIAYDTRPSKRKKRIDNALQMIREVRKHFLCLTENALIRAWEYTLASFSEIKMEFSRWNLYSSLGLHPEERGGLGKIIYTFVEEKIAECNEKLEEYHKDYELAFDQLRATETLLKQASSESDARRLKAEFQSRVHHMQSCLDLRDRFYQRSSFYPHLFSFLIKAFDTHFPQYFQEIYDAEMQEMEVTDYEDSPAGFRLVYKHGRRDASLWTMIHTEEQFINCLIDFFAFIEPQVIASCESKATEDDIKEVFSLIIIHLRTKDFIDTAYARAIQAHAGQPRSSRDVKAGPSEKKPWSYTSGGVMNTLIKTYYRREGEIYEDSFTVESPLDLLTLIIETMKSVPYNFSAYFPKDRDKRILMHSPTHAFSLLPYEKQFFDAWDDNGFTYTWIRDRLVLPHQNFYKSLSLSASEQEYLLALFAHFLPEKLVFALQRGVVPTERASIKEFARAVFSVMPQQPHLIDAFDSFLYQALPLTPAETMKEAIYSLVEEKAGSSLHKVLSLLPESASSYIPARLLKEIAKGVYLLCTGRSCLSFDLHRYITERAERLKLAAPSPLVFADSNWSQNYFGFVVSPIFEELQLWRVSESGYEGVNLRAWEPYMQPKSKMPWSMYTKPQEYASIFEKKM